MYRIEFLHQVIKINLVWNVAHSGLVSGLLAVKVHINELPPRRKINEI